MGRGHVHEMKNRRGEQLGDQPSCNEQQLPKSLGELRGNRRPQGSDCVCVWFFLQALVQEEGTRDNAFRLKGGDISMVHRCKLRKVGLTTIEHAA